MRHLDRQRKRLHTMFARAFGVSTAECVTGLPRTGLRLVAGEGRSYLGGPPRLDGATPWPTHFDAPLDPLAVLDVVELGPYDLPQLPSDIRFLNVFFLIDEPHLLWTGAESTSTWRVVPAGVDATESAAGDGARGSSRPVNLAPVLTLPAWENEIVARTLGVTEGLYRRAT